ncbi:hypothetical protein PENTCL1PPCAC_21584, partial [Pristionchus entomophagus]
MEIFLPIALQERVFFGQRVFFVVTSILNGISMYCLLKKTPPNQAIIRRYFILIQIFVIFSNVYLDILFEPILLFPAFAGYCVGNLCTAGVQPHAVMAGFIYLMYLIGIALGACSFYRHQTIIPASSVFRI